MKSMNWKPMPPRMPIAMAVITATVLLLTACSGGPEIRYYTLLPPAATTARPAEPAPALLFELLPVQVPQQVDYPQMVVRQDGGRMALVESRQWVAPLGDEIRAALSQGIGERLHSRDVYGLGAQDAVPVYRIKVQFSRFETVPGVYAQLDAQWSLSRSGTKAATSCDASVRQQAADGYDGVVAAHQRALGVLAERIARSVQRWNRDVADPCAEAPPAA
jgi:uncharacterized lipoprotein YmbA